MLNEFSQKLTYFSWAVIKGRFVTSFFGLFYVDFFYYLIFNILHLFYPAWTRAEVMPLFPLVC